MGLEDTILRELTDEEMTPRQKLGLLMQNWHRSQNDPVYAVGSFYFADEAHPSSETVERAKSRMQADFLRFEGDGHLAKEAGWGEYEKAELEQIIKGLDEFFEQDYP